MNTIEKQICLLFQWSFKKYDRVSETPTIITPVACDKVITPKEEKGTNKQG